MFTEYTDIILQIATLLQQKKWSLTTVESCTGGCLAATLTSIAGSSAWFERGFVTYSNLAKQQMVQVKPQTLEQYGAVSEQVAKEMALGSLQVAPAHVSIAITGIAGPAGGSADKPVGTVWFACAQAEKIIAQQKLFQGQRQEVREQAVAFALRYVWQFLQKDY